MPTGPQLRAKIQAVIAKVQASPRTLQFRAVTQTGGNTLLGIGGTTTVTLEDIDPQPVAEQVSAEEINSSGGLLQPGDWRFIFDGEIEEEDLRTKQLLFGDEILNIVRADPYTFGGVTAAWGVIARTVQART